MRGRGPAAGGRKTGLRGSTRVFPGEVTGSPSDLGHGHQFHRRPSRSRWGSRPSGAELLRNDSAAVFRKHGFCGQGASRPAGGAPAPGTGGRLQLGSQPRGYRPSETSAVCRHHRASAEWLVTTAPGTAVPSPDVPCRLQHWPRARAQPRPTTLMPEAAPTTGWGCLQVPDAGCPFGLQSTRGESCTSLGLWVWQA